MIPRRLLHLAFAFALLFAQQGAALHALSHLMNGTPAHSEQEKHLPHTPACDKCVAYAAVGSTASSSPLAFDGQKAVGLLAAIIPVPLFTSALQAYRSRAPPRSA
ncbi:MAG: hypothetical protein WC091_05840 [Sulfuricellaceae bacterium]